MKNHHAIRWLLLLALPVLFGQCTGSSGKAEDSPTAIPESNLRKFNTITLQPDTIKQSLNLTGRVMPLQKITVVAQVQGTAQATQQPFEEGTVFRQGQALIVIDDTDFRYSLSARKSQYLNALVRIMSDIKLDYSDHFTTWNNYLESVDIDQPIPALPKVDHAQLRYFLAANNVFDLYYNLKNQEEQLRDFVITAPFEGAVTSAQIDPGDLVVPGTQLGEFIRTDVYEVKAAVSASALAQLSEGQTVTLRARGVSATYEATIHRFGKSVDPSTQAISVYLRVAGDGLRDGMYLEGKVASKVYPEAVALPKTALTRENQVYTIQDSVVRLKDVTPLEFNRETVVVRGLAANDQVITDKILSPLQGTRAIAKQ